MRQQMLGWIRCFWMLSGSVRGRTLRPLCSAAPLQSTVMLTADVWVCFHWLRAMIGNCGWARLDRSGRGRDRGRRGCRDGEEAASLSSARRDQRTDMRIQRWW
jgi:hypothetical protein